MTFTNLQSTPNQTIFTCIASLITEKQVYAIV